jgi:hypothetical protein
MVSKTTNNPISKATELFDTASEALDFVAEYELDVARATLLHMGGRPADAAEVHIAEDRAIEGIQIFLENLTDEDCTRRAADHVLRALWQRLSFGISATVAEVDPLLRHWLGLAAKLNDEFLRPRDRDEVCIRLCIIAIVPNCADRYLCSRLSS